MGSNVGKEGTTQGVRFFVTSEEFPREGAWKEAGKLWQPLCEEG